MVRKRKGAERSGQVVLVVDDNPEFLQSTKRILEVAGHQALVASSGRIALHILRDRPVDLVLVDYLMPGMTGEEMVRELRRFNQTVQVVLQTGYAEENPPHELLRRLDIQGYHEKSDGPDKLLLWVDIGLKSARTMRYLEERRRALRFVLDATPAMHRAQPVDELLQVILQKMCALVFGAASSSGPDGFLAVMEEGTLSEVGAGLGRFLDGDPVSSSIDRDVLDDLRRCLESHSVMVTGAGLAVPLLVDELPLGVVYLERIPPEVDLELLMMLAYQGAIAIHNAQLYEMAALDVLTRAYTRRFFEQAFQRELRSAHRSRSPLTLLMVDVDELKKINDQGGHLAGDQALVAIGRLLRSSTRAGDVVGRYGGDEFAALLPNTDLVGAQVVVERILHNLSTLTAGDARPFAVRASIGVAVLAPPAIGPAARMSSGYFDQVAERLIAHADSSLYLAKRSGRACAADPITSGWPALDGTLGQSVRPD